MNLITVDFETHYSKEYSLSKISTEEYIRSPLFEVIGVAAAVNDEPAVWFSGTIIETIQWLRQFDWKNSFLLAQNCVTGDHEVRTRDGWVRLDALPDGVEILQWDAHTNKSSFVVPSTVIRKPYKGPMLKWDSNYHKGIYTPDHRMYIKTPNSLKKDWEVASAQDVSRRGPNNTYIPMAGVYESTTPLDIDGPTARLLEAIRADGHISRTSNAVRFKFTKVRKIERVRALLDSVGITYTEKVNKDGATVIIASKSWLYITARGLMGAGTDKTLGSWVLNLPIEARLAWLDEVQYWDGYRLDRGIESNKMSSVSTAKRADAYWLHEMATLSGFSAKVKYDVPNTRGWSTPTSVLHTVTIRKKTYVKTLYAPEQIAFDGTVYCVQVPTQAFVVRREGVTWATGNCVFDAAILDWVLMQDTPKGYFDTMSMSRAIDGVHVSASLAELAKRYTNKEKGTEVIKALGKRRKDFTPQELHDYGQYCINDVNLTREIFYGMLAKGFPKKELKVIDKTLRMFIQPRLVLNESILTEHLLKVRAKKEALLAQVNCSKDDLMSNQKFAEVLQSLGVEPPMKISPTTGKPALALAKSDEEFKALAEHENPLVQALVAARLGTKSTIEETRTERMLAASKRGYFPIPLGYHGALSGRWVGTDKFNCFTQGHEVLTPAGWVDIKDWQPTQGIMQWWPDGTLTWDFNASKISKPHTGELIAIDAPFAKGVFTPDHRMVSVSPYTGKVKERTAGWVASHSGLDYMRCAGHYRRDGSILTSEQVRLWVALSADGYVDPKGALHFGFVKQRKIDRLRNLLSALDIPCREYTHVNLRGSTVVAMTIVQKNVPNWLTKGFDARILKLDAPALQALIEEVRYWDGNGHYKSDATIFYTITEPDAQWVSTAAHLCGQRASVYKYPRETSTGFVFHVYMGTAAETSVDTKRHVRVFKDDCMVYCPSVESSYIIVRYDNAIHVTGQCQNIPRKSLIKKAIEAPPHFKLIGCDLSNIELRVGMWLAGQDDKLELFRAKRDLYKDFATKVFNVGYDEVTPDQRQTSKTATLALIFGTGANKLRASIKNLQGVDIGEVEAQRIVQVYRDDNPHLVDTWKQAKRVIESMAHGWLGVYGRNDLLKVTKESILLPSGLFLQYPDLKQTANDDGKAEWTYAQRRGRDRIYGPKVFQQCVQALARTIMAEILVRTKYRAVLTVHDALYYIVREAAVDEALEDIMADFTKAPDWAPDLPLAAEIAAGDNMLEV